jgi:hypothetical protein
MSGAIPFPETRAKAAEQLADRNMALWNEPDADVVKFHWEAVADDGSTAAVGLNVLVLAADGRVQRNYAFVDGA